MPASNRRDPISIQKLIPGLELNVLGELAVRDDANWQIHFEGFAEVVVKGQREFTRAGIINADVSHLVRIPLCTEALAVDGNMRMVLQATGEILHIEEAYRRAADNREVEMLCRG